MDDRADEAPVSSNQALLIELQLLLGGARAQQAEVRSSLAALIGFLDRPTSS